MDKTQTAPQTGILIGKRFKDGKSLLDTPAQGKVVTSDIAQKLVRTALGACLADKAHVRFADERYYLPTQDEVQYILDESKLDRKDWLSERFDCDDFSFILKGEISSHAYQAGQLTCGLCSGIVWGHFAWNKSYHAANWFLGADEQLFFIEPMWDTILDAGQCRKGIDLIVA